ncbi:MAG: response regulator [Myxococcales bacterium]|nr:response regulator [Myxococcales bacterium]
MPKRLLFVDDDAQFLASIERLLAIRGEADWEVICLNDPTAALAEIESGRGIDTVVTDVEMPGMSGLELLEAIRSREESIGIPVIVLTGARDTSLKRKAMDLGASDLLNKPVVWEELLARLKSSVRLKAQADQLIEMNQNLSELVAQRTEELSAARLDLLWRLAKAAEYRDEETGMHVVRVGLYSKRLGEALSLPGDQLRLLVATAPLHDIGKIGVPDDILRKPGKLSDAEWKVMRSHCEIGEKILTEESKAMLGYRRWFGEFQSHSKEDPMLEMAATIAMTHHEKWDGSGYPAGLSGDSIPLVGRIVAVSDVLDALLSKRPYKPAFSPEKCMEIITEGAGKHFDPQVVEAFADSFDDLIDLRASYSDPDEIVQ